MCESIEEAMDFIKKHCNKYKECRSENGNCRFWDEGEECCFWGMDILPCDWEIEKDGEI